MRRVLGLTFLLLLLLPGAAAVAADRPRDLLIDACRDEKVDGSYSQATYRHALDQLPADSDQYTSCRDVINRARLAALDNRGGKSGGGGAAGSTTGGGGGGGATGGGGGGSTGGGGSGSPSSSAATPAPPTPAEQKAVQKAITTGAEPVRVGGQLVRPGAVGELSSGARSLPTPLVALLLAVGLCAVAGIAATGWSRVLARRAG